MFGHLDGYDTPADQEYYRERRLDETQRWADVDRETAERLDRDRLARRDQALDRAAVVDADRRERERAEARAWFQHREERRQMLEEYGFDPYD